jgi:CheY-like chemotaxis protein
VLLVEDNSENVILMKAFLDKLSLALDFAANGIEAVEARKNTTYDLIFMDIQMPVMDGYTATREIRKWEAEHQRDSRQGDSRQGDSHVARVPIVALTAHALTGASAESLEAGCDGHLTKPVGRAELVAAIAKFASRRSDMKVDMDEKIADTIAALRPAYLANRHADLLKMRDALAAGQFAVIESIGHNCKGTGTGYGFPAITRLGASLQTAAHVRDAEAVEESLRQFNLCISDASSEALALLGPA